MKRCPFCAETINDDAIKCRFCQSALREAARGAQAITRFAVAFVLAAAVVAGAATLAGGILSRATTVSVVVEDAGAKGTTARTGATGADDKIPVRPTAGARRESGEQRERDAGVGGGGRDKAPRPFEPAPRLDDIAPRPMKKNAPT